MQEVAKDELTLDFNFRKFFTTLSNLKVFAILFVVGFLIYGNSLFNGFVGDDLPQIKDNVLVHSVSNMGIFFTQSNFNDKGANANSYYRPMQPVIISLIYLLFFGSTFGFHFAQVVIHITNSFLLFLILKHFLKKQFVPFFISLLFLIHPINTEAVVYMALIQDPLFLFFWFVGYLFSSKRLRQDFF